MTQTSKPDASEMPASARKTILGVLAGGGVIMAIMLLLAGMAVLFGWIRHAEDGRLGLRPWMVLEIIGGVAASVLGGTIARGVAGHYRGPAILAVMVLSVGLLEAAAIFHYGAAVGVIAPKWLVMLAPVAAAAGVLLGGWRPTTRCDRPRAGRRTVRMSEAMRYSLPVVVLAATTALSLFGFPELDEGPKSQVAAAALALDFTVTTPALVFFLLVRARRVPWITIIPTFFVGYALAVATIPPQHHAVLEMMRLVVVPVELAVVGYLVVVTRKMFAIAPRGDNDFATRLRSAARRALGSRIPADILATELAILYYALRWRKPSPESLGAFTVHREVGYLTILIALLVLLVVETIALHVLVSQWGATATWILTGLSIYAVIWLVGDYRAMVARPTRITPIRLSIRVGVRWEAEIPIDRIAEVGPMHPHRETRDRDTLVVALLGQPNLRLRLTEPVEVIGMYGIRRTVREIWLRVDEAERLCQELSGSGVAGGSTTPP